MALSAGDKLGPYEIVEAIGKGGMGEVYRARDSRVGRDVAVKVSEQRFGERFEREARAIAALNHPNICTLFDVGPNYLVMELVEGPTLAERIKEGAIPLEESLNIARQIADALEAAHEKGIVHRDLKPGNVIVKEDGSVKVLDFGLAKVAPTSRSSSDNDNPELSPTISMAATQAGVILGTAAYMSPEQARGKPVDKRADIWSFGVVLYEMVTGQKLFKGEDLTETLASVVKEKPDLSQIPDQLRPLLEKCLEKNPSQRLRDIGDWKALLDAGLAQSQLQAEARPSSGGGPMWLWPAVAATAIVIAGIGFWSPWRSAQPEDRPLVRLEVNLGDIDLGPAANNVIFSPDGTRIAYVATPIAGGPPQLYTRRLDQETAIVLQGSDGASLPFFSPDGEWIGFGDPVAGQLKKISVQGGTAINLAPVPEGRFSGASWSEDGYIVYGVSANGLWRVPDGGGESELMTPLAAGQLSYTAPQVLPGGRTVLFTLTQAFGQPASIDVVSMDSGERKTIVPGGKTGRYLPSGHLIYLKDRTLFAVPFDAERLETRGSAIPLFEGVGSDPRGQASLAFSSNGTLVYRSGSGPGTGAGAMSTVEWLDVAGNREAIISTPGAYAQPRLSPDEQRLVMRVGNGPAMGRIEVYDIQRGGFSPLTFENGMYSRPIWSPDGRFVVFGSENSLIWARADGAGQPQRLLEVSGPVQPYSFSPDGGRVAFEQIVNLPDIWTAPLTVEGDRLLAGNPEEFLATQFGEGLPSFSPDGRWLAYASTDSGRDEISVRAFPPLASGQGAKFPVSTDGGIYPFWSRNSDELFFLADGRIMAANYRVNGDNFVADRPRVWATLDGNLTGASLWGMASDGRALITVPVRSDEPQAAPEPQHQVVFLQNLFDELRRRVPVEGN